MQIGRRIFEKFPWHKRSTNNVLGSHKEAKALFREIQGLKTPSK